ncbi:MAG: hypothetical protein ACREHF_04540 [Rhizomicrobium sp.]
MATEVYCQTCGSVGKAKNQNRGSAFIEVVLWLCFLVPGLLYSLWRMGRIDRYCRTCRAPNPIPVDSPLAQRALNGQTPANIASPVKPAVSAPVQATRTSREVSGQLAIGIFFLPFIFGWALVKPGYSNVARVVTAAWGLMVTVPLLIGIFTSDMPPSHAAETPQKARQASATPKSGQTQVAANDNPLAGVRQWDAYLDGNKIACYEDPHSGHRWYIVVPTPEQRADGETMVVNNDPSDAAWSESCTKQAVMAHW